MPPAAARVRLLAEATSTARDSPQTTRKVRPRTGTTPSLSPLSTTVLGAAHPTLWPFARVRQPIREPAADRRLSLSGHAARPSRATSDCAAVPALAGPATMPPMTATTMLPVPTPTPQPIRTKTLHRGSPHSPDGPFDTLLGQVAPIWSGLLARVGGGTEPAKDEAGPVRNGQAQPCGRVIFRHPHIPSRCSATGLCAATLNWSHPC